MLEGELAIEVQPPGLHGTGTTSSVLNSERGREAIAVHEPASECRYYIRAAMTDGGGRRVLEPGMGSSLEVVMPVSKTKRLAK